MSQHSPLPINHVHADANHPIRRSMPHESALPLLVTIAATLSLALVLVVLAAANFTLSAQVSNLLT